MLTFKHSQGGAQHQSKRDCNKDRLSHQVGETAPACNVHNLTTLTVYVPCLPIMLNTCMGQICVCVWGGGLQYVRFFPQELLALYRDEEFIHSQIRITNKYNTSLPNVKPHNKYAIGYVTLLRPSF